MPLFADETFERWFAEHEPEGDGRRGSVLLWPDTFTNHFHPHIGRAAVRVLEQAGWRVELPHEPLCCGLTWVSTGQLGTAERVLTRTVRALAGHVRSGGLVVALEPSCTAVFRADAKELFPGDQDVLRLAEQTVTLSELLTEHSPATSRRGSRNAPRVRSPRCTATSTRYWAGRPTGSCCAGPGWTRNDWTPAAAGWPATSASSAVTWT